MPNSENKLPSWIFLLLSIFAVSVTDTTSEFVTSPDVKDVISDEMETEPEVLNCQAPFFVVK